MEQTQSPQLTDQDKIYLIKTPYTVKKTRSVKNKSTNKLEEKEYEITKYLWQFAMRLNTGEMKSVQMKSKKGIEGLLYDTITSAPSIQVELGFDPQGGGVFSPKCLLNDK